MSIPKKYNRSSSSITISLFHEYDLLGKFNYDPVYQRDNNIWGRVEKEFLIDTIFKNFPMPPIFLEQKIKNGVTTYDVIDGKQRLTAIKDFINNEISLPKNFSEDDYGYKELNGKFFKEITEMAEDDRVIAEFLNVFWSYDLGIEYISMPDREVVKNIFDRLNRNGKRLNPAELRKAQFSETDLYKKIETIKDSEDANRIYNSQKDKRQRCMNFWTEIFIFVHEKKICPGGAKFLESKMREMLSLDRGALEEISICVRKIITCFLKWDLISNEYDVLKEAHLYALLYLADKLKDLSNPDLTQIGILLNNFYEKLRAGEGTYNDTNLQTYYDSTQSGSKSVKARKARFNALVTSLGLECINEK